MVKTIRSKECCHLSSLQKPIYDRIKGELKTLLRHGELIHYKAGQVIFYEGHLPCGFFFLKTGIVNAAHEECLLGLAHLIANTPYCTTCAAKSNVDVVFVGKSAVSKFLTEVL